MSYYQRHIFFCTNLKTNGKKCCAQGNANERREEAKRKLKKLGLHEPGGVRTSTSGCMGRCDEGPVLVIYPDNIWYTYQSSQDVEEIIEQHIINNSIVDRLLLKS